MSSSVSELVAVAATALASAGIESARLDAHLLVAAAAGVEPSAIASGRVAWSCALDERFRALLHRRLAREPLAYITGHKEFYSLEFEVTRDVLIPRPETETLVDAALKLVASKQTASVLDIGTGSGAIAIAIAANAPNVRVTATDESALALDVARCNAQRLGVDSRVEFQLADVLAPAQGTSLGRYGLIVSNPPYVEDAAIDSLAPEICRHEPRIALAGGRDGLDFYRRIAADCRRHLADDGALMVEVGAGQAAAVAGIFAAAGLRGSDVINDLAGIARVVVARA